MLLGQLNCTEDCIKLGKHITKEQVVVLKRNEILCTMSAHKWQRLGDFNTAMIMAVKAQFCSETIHFSKFD